jgi:hypothetical protein
VGEWHTHLLVQGHLLSGAAVHINRGLVVINAVYVL